jgi:hypothetical protein
MKLYRLFWTNEGILWRRRNYVVFEQRGKIKPGMKRKWELRKVHGKPGMQSQELESSHWNAEDAFRAGNKAIRVGKN